MPNKATHCKVCGCDLSKDVKPFGKLCHQHYLEACRAYNSHPEHKKKLAAQNKRNRIMSASLKEPKTREARSKLPIEELKRRKDERTKSSNFKQKIKNYLKKHPEVHVRPPVKKNEDHFLYEDNETWIIDNNYYLNIDEIMSCPESHLTTDFWDTYYMNLSAETEVYVKRKDYEFMLEQQSRWNCSYTREDISYGLDENGKLQRFWPT